ncbi:MAG TPA: WecB/TagA/CpsF family glycosyltransferase [Actinomycetes bacterium]|nr:WecB/TagA/CpsF family glycosyltransferase [Actinomycetes bacterium]
MSSIPAPWPPADTVVFAGVRLLDLATAEAVDALVAAATAGTGHGVHLCNAYTLSLAADDTGYRAALTHDGAVNLADGVPVAWFSGLARRQRSRGPVRGPDLMQEALARPAVRHFLLGGTDQVLVDLERAIKARAPDAVVCGRLAPPFRDPGPADLDEWRAAIDASGADLVWVGLGTPRQDQVIAALAGRTRAVLVGVGAAFDFLSGHKKQAPRILHRTGLEWVWRLVSEPRRLWRRYLFGNTRFVVAAVGELRRERSSARVG